MLTNEPSEDEDDWISEYDHDYLKATFKLAEWLSPGYEWDEVVPGAPEIPEGTIHLERLHMIRDNKPSLVLSGKMGLGPTRTLERVGDAITIWCGNWKADAQLEVDWL